MLNWVIADSTWLRYCRHLEAKNWYIQSFYSKAAPASQQFLKHFCSLAIMQHVFSVVWAVVTIKAGPAQAWLNKAKLCDCKSSSVVPAPGN